MRGVVLPPPRKPERRVTGTVAFEEDEGFGRFGSGEEDIEMNEREKERTGGKMRRVGREST